MCEATPPLHQYVVMAWCLVKHRDNFTLPYLRYYRTMMAVKGFSRKLL